MNAKHTNNRVLIVDDEPLIRSVIAEALRHWGFEPVEAGTASEAVAAFDRSHPVAILLDIHLPDVSGLALLRDFKKRRPFTPIIIITGEVIVENTIAALRGGADDFIGKPINLNELDYALRTSITPAQAGDQDAEPRKLRMLVVTDSAERLGSLKSTLGVIEAEIAGVKSQDELKLECRQKHDIAVVDLAADGLKEALGLIRSSEGHTDIPVLVSTRRIANDPGISGVMPEYRAMPCSESEVLALVRRRVTTISEKFATRRIF